MSDPQAPSGLTSEEAEVFARGLYHLANVDGIEPREERLIRDFIVESNAPLSYDEIGTAPFSPIEAALALPASYLRRIFVKTAILLVRADGRYSDAERRTIGEIADAFGLTNAEFGDLEQQASHESLE